MKKKNWFIAGGVLALALLVLFYMFYTSKFSADSLQANRGTTIQIVGTDGNPINEELKVELNFVTSYRACGGKWTFRKSRSGKSWSSENWNADKCTKVIGKGSVAKQVKTNAKGQLLVTGAMLDSLSLGEVGNIFEDVTADLTGKTVEFHGTNDMMRDFEAQRLYAKYRTNKEKLTGEEIANSMVRLKSDWKLTDDQIKQISDKVASDLNNYNEMLPNDRIIQRAGNPFIDSVTVGVLSARYSADPRILMFDKDNYQEKVNLTVKPNSGDALTEGQKAFYKKIDSILVDKTQLKNNLYFLQLYNEFQDLVKANGAQAALENADFNTKITNYFKDGPAKDKNVDDVMLKLKSSIL